MAKKIKFAFFIFTKNRKTYFKNASISAIQRIHAKKIV